MSQHLPHARKNVLVRGAAAMGSYRPCALQWAHGFEDFPHPGEEAV